MKDNLNFWIKPCLLLKEIIAYLYWNVVSACELEIWLKQGIFICITETLKVGWSIDFTAQWYTSNVLTRRESNSFGFNWVVPNL